MWKYYAILSAFFAGLTAVFAKLGVKGVGANVATSVRTVVILFMAWGIILFTGEVKSLKYISKSALWFLIISGITTGLSWIFYFKALESGPVSKVAPIDKLSLAFAMGFSFLILKEEIDIKTLTGGLLIIAGTLVIIW